MGNDVTTDLKVNNAQMKRELDESKASFERFGSGVKRTIGAVGTFLAARQIFSWGKDFVQAAIESEAAEKRLDQALRTSGKGAGVSREEMKSLASELQNLTNIEDEAIMGVESLFLRFQNIKGDQLKEAVRLSTDLSVAMGTDVAAAAQTMARALNEPDEGLRMLRRSGANFTDEEIELVKALVATGNAAEAQDFVLKRVRETVGGMAEELAKTTGGRMKSFMVRLGDIAETIGGALMPAVEAVLPYVEWLSKRFAEAIPILGDVISWLGGVAKTVWEFIKPALTWLGDAAIVAFTVVQTAVENFVDVAVRVFKGFELVVVQVWNNIIYFLTEVIPEYLSWFGRNWKSIFEDIWNYIKTVTANMWDNLSLFFTNVWKWLKGDQGDWRWTSLEEGFERTCEALPKIAERRKGDLERALEIETAALDRRLAKSFDKNLEINRAAMKGFFESFNFAPGAALAPAAGGKPGTAGYVGGGGAGAGDKKTTDAEGFKASIEDLVSLNKRITTAAASIEKDKAAAAEAEKQRKAAEKLAEQQTVANKFLEGIQTATEKTAAGIDKAGALK